MKKIKPILLKDILNADLFNSVNEVECSRYEHSLLEQAGILTNLTFEEFENKKKKLQANIEDGLKEEKNPFSLRKLLLKLFFNGFASVIYSYILFLYIIPTEKVGISGFSTYLFVLGIIILSGLFIILGDEIRSRMGYEGKFPIGHRIKYIFKTYIIGWVVALSVIAAIGYISPEADPASKGGCLNNWIIQKEK